MEKMLKKQRVKLIIKISAILLAVWLILSCAYSAVTFFAEKEEQFRAAETAFADWQKSLDSFASKPVLCIDSIRKNAVITSQEDKDSDEITYRYDRDVNLVIEEPDRGTVYDSDDIIDITFTAASEDPEYREQYNGYLSFKRLRSSMTDEQYERILYYLDNQPEGMYRYELLCTEFYRTQKNELIPKTLQIVSTRGVHKWYVQDIRVETFELEPQDVKWLTPHRISYLNRNEIPEEFIRCAFGSGSLVSQAQALSAQKAGGTEQSVAERSEGSAELLKVSLFEYLYYDVCHVPMRDFVFSDSGLIALSEEEDFTEQSNVYYFYRNESYVSCARRINILDACRKSILTASGILFVFFLVIGVILSVMMWKILKTQMLEEQKRRDMTNTLAHDIKTPLFILSGYAGNLKDNIQTDKRDHYADVIVEQSQEVNRRVNRMLELSRLDSSGMKPDLSDFDLTALIDELLKNYEALPDGKAIEYLAEPSDNSRLLRADRELMSRAVENLIDNAVKYSDRDSVVRIRVTSDSFVITNQCSDSGKTGCLTRQAGKGNAHTRASSTGGSGFGLSITRSILDLHGFRFITAVKDTTVTMQVRF